MWSALNTLASGNVVEAGNDVISPTYVPDLVHAALDLMIDGGTGIWHVTNPGEISWRQLTDRVARLGGFDPELVLETPDAESLNTALASERGTLLPPLESALDRFFRDSEVDWAASDALGVAAE
jgi:dTDP-4-dehydrorhamnose reductase